ncbi:cysteine hydrolase [Staphylococcus gallinarum]|uniref:Cysteine hydrolase n=1 Tax=Staphylococcus gallinarum TaxID=1293 RepID=A0A418HPV2_STAGA|nr:cysteine hydrolase family protein [Staphylococcus gallinarum]MCD8826465.1 cysteine hydrolase [Staphylococcus gallinarum]PTE77375.1 cysteine hydrolase [Staphylococcus gallinarum]RIL43322.1 cysteine hydrolase [Staphylococcus gallinarum]RIO84749.1 cysteine hydrolase [Staphylococcus gallinarum]
MNTALIIVDIQNDYFSGGKYPLSNPEQAANNAKKVLNWFRENNSENIYHIQHIAPDESLGFFAPNTEGTNIRDIVQPLDNETLITKQLPNSFVNTDLHDKLQSKNIDHVVIVGMMTHMCIDATARAAADLGYKVSVIEDACASRDLTYKSKVVAADDAHYAFISALDLLYADIYTADDFIQQQ